MRVRRFTPWVVITVVLGFALALAAQPAPVFVGTFSEPFTTFTITGELTYPGELVWYRFDVTDNDSTIFITTDRADSEVGIRALLYDGEETYIHATEDGIMESSLAAGTYLIRIDSIGSRVQSYSLTLFNGIESESNDGLIEADNLDELDGPVVLTASLLPAGDVDFFRFEIPSSGLPGDNNAVHIDTSGPSAGDTVLILYQFSEVEERYLPIAADDDSGEGYWSQLLLQPLPGDRYAIRVEETTFPLEGLETYGVSIEPITLTDDDEPNNTSADATALNPTSSNADAWATAGLLDADDTVDFYKLTIETSSLVQITTNSQVNAGDFDTLLSLYSSSGDRLAESDNYGDSAWSRVLVPLDPGEYFITVETGEYETGLVPYRLNAVAQKVTHLAEREPNDTDESAELIVWIEGVALLIEAVIGLDGDVDSFRFILTQETTVTFETGPMVGSTETFDTTLAIYDEDLWEVASNDDSEGTWSRISTTLQAGTYYAIVEGYYDDQTFEYTLLITVEGNET